MYDFINRFAESDDPAIQQSLAPILGNNVRGRISAYPGDRQAAIASLFRENLKAAGNFKYTLTAPVSKPLADRPLFMLAYGTKSYAGLTTFRRIERKAMSSYAVVRERAKQRAEESRTGQPRLLEADEETAKREFEQGLYLVRQDARDFITEVVLARSPSRAFVQVSAAVMARFPLTEPDVKAICVELARAGLIDESWKKRSRRARGPNSDDQIRIAR